MDFKMLNPRIEYQWYTMTFYIKKALFVDHFGHFHSETEVCKLRSTVPKWNKTCATCFVII